MNNSSDKKLILCICGPSGTGKSTLIDMCIATYPFLFQRFITVTDRPMRAYENQNNPHRFVSKKEMDRMIIENDMLEYEIQPHNNCRYGKAISVLKELDKDKIILTELQIHKIDTLKSEIKKFDKKFRVISFFLHIDDMEKLKNRLRERGDSDNQVENRIKTMTDEEVKNMNLADYILPSVEGELDKTMGELMKILREEFNIIDK